MSEGRHLLAPALLLSYVRVILSRTLRHIRWLILLTVCVNASAMLSPLINSGDAVTYASIARHIAISHDWASLVLDGRDWLDKPHFPFWATALSFRIGGVSALTYVIPGFLFHLLGAYYIHRLAEMLYDKQTAVLAVLLYVSTFALMDSSIAIKAEAYLVMDILAACYYWLRYDRESRARYLVSGAVFTGMAIMTKGIFMIFGGWLAMCCSIPRTAALRSFAQRENDLILAAEIDHGRETGARLRRRASSRPAITSPRRQCPRRSVTAAREPTNARGWSGIR